MRDVGGALCSGESISEGLKVSHMPLTMEELEEHMQVGDEVIDMLDDDAHYGLDVEMKITLRILNAHEIEQMRSAELVDKVRPLRALLKQRQQEQQSP